MAEQHLLKIYNSIDAPSDLKNTIKKLFKTLLQKTLIHEKKKISSSFKHKNSKKTQSKSIDSSYSSKSILPSHAREEFFKDFKHKEAVSKEFAKKLSTDQKERERRQKERDFEERLKKDEENKELEKQKQEELSRYEAERNKFLQDLKEKSSKRKQHIKELADLGNHEYKKVISAKPLHEKINEKYYEKVIMPELEKHKQKLAKIREAFRPISQSVIMEHAKKHDLFMEEHENRKKNSSQMVIYDTSKLRSKFTEAYIEDRKKKKQDLDNELLSKKAKADKKKQYSKLVLEMFQPVVDPSKQNELQVIKEKLKGTANEIARKKSAKSLEIRNSSVSEQPKKRKWKKNDMIPDKPAKKNPVIVDWLGEKRKNRENAEDKGSDRNFTDKVKEDSDDMRVKVKKIEKELRKGEIELAVSKQTNLKGIEKSEYVHSMLIDSIKGKLAMLEKN